MLPVSDEYSKVPNPHERDQALVNKSQEFTPPSQGTMSLQKT